MKDKREPQAPRARKEGLLIQELHGEVLVYDLEREEYAADDYQIERREEVAAASLAPGAKPVCGPRTVRASHMTSGISTLRILEDFLQGK